ncbi:MAG: peptidase [Capsulimonas sp.]|nr:peptidase [Capsulimonas sp.]
MNTGASSPERRRRPLRLRIHSALRWLHIYLSLLSLLIVLFFSVTGVTLNHPEWTFGQKETTRDVTGTMPADWRTSNGVDWLRVADTLREKQGVRGRVTERRDEGGEASISFRAPGYSADGYIKQKTGAYTVTIVGAGTMETLNDLHRGHDAGTAWARAVDLAGIFLTVISLTGIGLFLYLKKLRLSGLAVLAASCLIVFLLLRTTS